MNYFTHSSLQPSLPAGPGCWTKHTSLCFTDLDSDTSWPHTSRSLSTSQDPSALSFNQAYGEDDLIDQLCSCQQHDWCFIHSKAIVIDTTSEKAFGFMPLSIIRPPLFKPTTDLHNCNTLQWAIQAHRIVKNTGEYNYQHARIRVPTELHINNWRQLCSNYHDPLLLDYLEFGFPLCIDRSKLKFTEFVDNHHSAVNFPHDMDAYFTKELSHKAIVGPCINLPFKVHHSPMLSRPKVNDTRRVIVNLSHPYGNSINDCISNQCHDGIVFNLKYPTVDSIIDAIREKDGDVLLSKIDISRAFRNLRLDP